MIDLDENIKISRYLDLIKLLDFIQFDRLYFRQVDKYDDVFEGSFPKIMYEVANGISVTDENGVTGNKGIIERTKQIRQSTYVSCWTAKTYECMALWNLYGGKNGLCIQTDSHTLMNEAVKSWCADNQDLSVILQSIKPRVSRIRYVDHSNLNIESDPYEFSKLPIIFKNNGFAYEDEIRFFYDIRQLPLSVVVQKFGEGFSLRINTKHIIQKVLVSPLAEQSFFDNVHKLLSQSGLENRLEWSGLKYPPYNDQTISKQTTGS